MGGSIHPFPAARVTHHHPAEDVCVHRQVSADGRVTCGKVGRGNAVQCPSKSKRALDAEVSPALCATCPSRLVSCQHLRYTLRKHEPVAIVVRYAGGHTEVWDDVPPSMKFSTAACALRREPVQSPADCAGCTLRFSVHADRAERGGGVVVPLRPVPFEGKKGTGLRPPAARVEQAVRA